MYFLNNYMRLYLPYEIVDEIADYHDYDKYCKPKHKTLFNKVMKNIVEMSEVFYNDNNLPPSIAYQCWGNGWPREWDLDSDDGFHEIDEY